jgi:hypothetical protein
MKRLENALHRHRPIEVGLLGTSKLSLLPKTMNEDRLSLFSVSFN